MSKQLNIVNENGKWNVYRFSIFNWVVPYFNKGELVESFDNEDDAKSFKNNN